jgi:hypothetical protein
MKFGWQHSNDGTVNCRISQEGYAAAIIEEMGLTNANKSPLMTPFRSGLPVDTIPAVDMTPEAWAPLTAKMQSWLGMINWLQMCTRPDLATIFSLLSSYMHCPSPGHLEAVKHVGKYILSNMDLGLHFSPQPNLKMMILQLLVTHRPLIVFAMLIGVHRMHQNLLLLTLERYPLRKHVLYAATFSLWGDVRFYGKLIKNLASAEVPVKLRWKLLMNVSKMFRHFVIHLMIYSYWILPYQPMFTMIIADRYIGLTLSALRACIMSILVKMPLEKLVLWMKLSYYIFLVLTIRLIFLLKSSSPIPLSEIWEILPFFILRPSKNDYFILFLAWMGGVKSQISNYEFQSLKLELLQFQEVTALHFLCFSDFICSQLLIHQGFQW